MENGDSEDENFVGGSRKRSRESKPVTVKQEPKAEPESEENNEESELDSEDEAPLNKRKAIAKKSPVNKAPTTKSPKPNAVNENNNKYHAQPVGEEVLHGIPANDIHACAFDVNIPPQPRQVPAIEVKFRLSADFVLTVEARDPDTKRHKAWVQNKGAIVVKG
eukprot:gene24912-30378_t